MLPSAFVVFHGLILIGVLPRNIVWSGRLTDATILPLELLEIVINLLLIVTGTVAGGIQDCRVTDRTQTGRLDKVVPVLLRRGQHDR